MRRTRFTNTGDNAGSLSDVIFPRRNVLDNFLLFLTIMSVIKDAIINEVDTKSHKCVKRAVGQHSLLSDNRRKYDALCFRSIRTKCNNSIRIKTRA